LAIECDACGASVAVGARFCGECGGVVRAKTRELDRTGQKGARATQPLKPKPKDAQPRAQGKTIPMAGGKPVVTRPAAATQRGPALDSLRTTAKGLPAAAEPAPSAAAAPPPAAAAAPAPAPAPSAAATPPSSEFQRLLDEVETGFDVILEAPAGVDAKLVADDAAGPPTTENEFDESQVKQLFFELVVANARAIRDFMIEVRLGEPHVAWVDYCAPSVRAILGSAQGMGYGDLAVKLRSFIDVLESVRREPSAIIRGEERERVIDAYSELIVFLPEAFGLEAEANARETQIVRALLAKVPGLFKVGLDRVYATGMVSLGLFYVSRPQDIAALSGVAVDVAERISARFREYRKLVSELTPARGRSDEHARLRRAAEAMLEASRAYDAARPASKEKRTERRLRSDAWVDASLWLARLGEVERLKSLSTLPFSLRAENLASFLSDADKRSDVERRAL
jgi:hypothetical protein